MRMAVALRALLAAAAIAVIFDAATAADIVVGGPSNRWAQGVDYQAWAKTHKFTVGDKLIFQYSLNHDVLEVTKAAYDSCQTSGPISTDSGGSTTIPLTAGGKRWFICSTGGHCDGGQKLEVDVVAAAATPSPTAGTPPAAAGVPVAQAPTTGPTSSAPPPPPPPPSKSGADSGSSFVRTAMGIGAGLLLAVLA